MLPDRPFINRGREIGGAMAKLLGPVSRTFDAQLLNRTGSEPLTLALGAARTFQQLALVGLASSNNRLAGIALVVGAKVLELGAEGATRFFENRALQQRDQLLTFSH